jgi:hypothetical protein
MRFLTKAKLRHRIHYPPPPTMLLPTVKPMSSGTQGLSMLELSLVQYWNYSPMYILWSACLYRWQACPLS